MSFLISHVVFQSRTSHEVRGLKLDLSINMYRKLKSHLTRGAWIEIYIRHPLNKRLSRTSHEVRGLKYPASRRGVYYLQSHLTRGAWIEIVSGCHKLVATRCRTSHEVRGLKSTSIFLSNSTFCRTSHEVRGLK